MGRSWRLWLLLRCEEHLFWHESAVFHPPSGALRHSPFGCSPSGNAPLHQPSLWLRCFRSAQKTKAALALLATQKHWLCCFCFAALSTKANNLAALGQGRGYWCLASLRSHKSGRGRCTRASSVRLVCVVSTHNECHKSPTGTKASSMKSHSLTLILTKASSVSPVGLYLQGTKCLYECLFRVGILDGRAPYSL
jgi:hypothetical protein